MISHRRSYRWVIGLAAVVLALAACSGDDDDSDESGLPARDSDTEADGDASDDGGISDKSSSDADDADADDTGEEEAGDDDESGGADWADDFPPCTDLPGTAVDDSTMGCLDSAGEPIVRISWDCTDGRELFFVGADDVDYWGFAGGEWLSGPEDTVDLSENCDDVPSS